MVFLRRNVSVFAVVYPWGVVPMQQLLVEG